MSTLQMNQIALTTLDLPKSLRFYAEVFDFENAGGIPIWGESMPLQGLAKSSRALMWWIVDGQPFFQVEFFTYFEPISRVRPADWKPNDHGWVRFGVLVPSLDAIGVVLARWEVPVLGRVEDEKGPRRMSFIDPTTGTLLEAIESDTVARPQVQYATYSTADIGQSRKLYCDILGLAILPPDMFHRPEHEMLWGLGGAETVGFVVDTGAVKVEIVQYLQPAGRPKSPEAAITDVGIMNVALGARDDAPVRTIIKKIQAAGYSTTPLVSGEGFVVTYLTDVGTDLEISAVPKEADSKWGFQPAHPFLAVESKNPQDKKRS